MKFLTSRDSDSETRMSNSRRQLFLMAAISLLVAAPWAPAAIAQQGGILTGRVTDARSSQPVAGAAIVVEGTALATTADDDGRFRLANVQAANKRSPRGVLATPPGGSR